MALELRDGLEDNYLANIEKGFLDAFRANPGATQMLGQAGLASLTGGTSFFGNLMGGMNNQPYNPVPPQQPANNNQILLFGGLAFVLVLIFRK